MIVLDRNIPNDEMMILLARRIRNATQIDQYFCDEVARFLIESGHVTSKTMFGEDRKFEKTVEKSLEAAGLPPLTQEEMS